MSHLSKKHLRSANIEFSARTSLREVVRQVARGHAGTHFSQLREHPEGDLRVLTVSSDAKPSTPANSASKMRSMPLNVTVL